MLGASAATVLDRLYVEICERRAGRGLTSATGKSYVRGLMDGGVPAIAAKLLDEHDVWVNAPRPTSLRLLPPLTILDEQIDDGVARIAAALAS